MKILLTGSTSIHGWPILRQLRQRFSPTSVCAICPPDTVLPRGENLLPVCLTDADTLREIRDTVMPTHIIHAGGVCDLDACEEEPVRARILNVLTAKVIADVFGETCHCMYLSADLVFSGNNPPAHGYTEENQPDPISVVGTTFLEAEAFFRRLPRWCIIRLGLPMGASIDGHKGGLDFIEGRLSRNLPMSLFDDEFRSCIYCAELAQSVVDMLGRSADGLYHLGGARAISLYEIGDAILKRGGYAQSCLKRWSRNDDIHGPPRIGNVHLDSRKIEALLGKKMSAWIIDTEGFWFRGNK